MEFRKVHTMQLFDDFVRTDGTPRKAMEGLYAFLNRSSWPVCVRARILYQSWFDRYPDDDHQKGLYRRFTSKRDKEHQSAYFELLLHEVLTCMGAKLTLEPSVPGTSKTPDFLVELDGDRFYVEAMVNYAKENNLLDSPIFDIVCEWIDEMDIPEYLVHIFLSAQPTCMPTNASISAQITRLIQLENNEVTRQQLFEAGHHSSTIGFLEIADAYARVNLVPRAAEHVGVAGLPNVVRSTGGVMLDVATEWRESIRRKAKSKDMHLYDAPCVLAVDVMDGFARIGDKGLQAVYGADNGFARQGGIWKNANAGSWRDKLAAVWMFHYVEPVQASPSGIEDCLLLSPSIEQALPKSLRDLTQIRPENGEFQGHDGVSLDQLLGVPDIPYDELRQGASALC